MTIQLISFNSSLDANKRFHLTTQIINLTTSDLILFPGHTLATNSAATKLSSLVTNKTTSAILEVEEDNSSPFNPVCNSLYLLQNGICKSMFSYQLFAESEQIRDDQELGEHLILDLETRRRFMVGNRQAVILQCGEIGILRNIQAEGNRAVFQFKENKSLCKRFDEVINNADIILNPMHSPMGNQGKMLKRREYFSAQNRAYFSTANYTEVTSIMHKSLQYAFVNGVTREPLNVEIGKESDFLSRTFII